MKKLNTITCEEIMTEPLKPTSFFVDGLITQGLYILAGAPKVGKSWLSLDICHSVSKGLPVLSRSTIQGTALYLCLEDSRIRIQSRLYEITDEPTANLHFAMLAGSIGDGLEEQIENFISEHADTKIVFIDTLQKVRTAMPENAYAADYKELSAVKSVADKHEIAIVLVHHLNSLQNQRQILVDYSEQNGYEIVGESFDDNVSGMTFDRKGLNEMEDAVSEGKFDMVLVKDLSRLGRHRTQTALFIDHLRENNVKVYSVTEGIDTANENDDLLIGFKQIFNDFYAKDISKKIRTGLRQKQKNTGMSQCSFGYAPCLSVL